MRRPKRTLASELGAHIRLADAARTVCSTLVTLEPEVAEFMVARKMLDDAIEDLEQKRTDAMAPKAPALLPETV